MNIINLLNSIAPVQTSDPMILSGIILMVLSFCLPCLIWFIRNLYRVITRNDYWWTGLVIKISWGVGGVLFIIGLILLVVKITTGS